MLGAKSSPNIWRQANPLAAKPRGETTSKTQDTRSYHYCTVSTLLVSRTGKQQGLHYPGISTRSPRLLQVSARSRSSFSCRPRRLFTSCVRVPVQLPWYQRLYLIDNDCLVSHISSTSGTLIIEILMGVPMVSQWLSQSYVRPYVNIVRTSQ